MKNQVGSRVRKTESSLDYVGAYQRAIELRRAEEAAALAELTLEAGERIRASFRKLAHAVGKAFLRSQPSA